MCNRGFGSMAHNKVNQKPRVSEVILERGALQSIPKTSRDEPYLDWTILQQVDEAHTKLNHGIVLQVYHTEPTPSQISPTIDDNDVNEDIASVYEHFDTKETIAPVTTNGILLRRSNKFKVKGH